MEAATCELSFIATGYAAGPPAAGGGAEPDKRVTMKITMGDPGCAPGGEGGREAPGAGEAGPCGPLGRGARWGAAPVRARSRTRVCALPGRVGRSGRHPGYKRLCTHARPHPTSTSPLVRPPQVPVHCKDDGLCGARAAAGAPRRAGQRRRPRRRVHGARAAGRGAGGGGRGCSGLARWAARGRGPWRHGRMSSRRPVHDPNEWPLLPSPHLPWQSGFLLRDSTLKQRLQAEGITFEVTHEGGAAAGAAEAAQ